MNKTAIKNFAVWARNKLIADITYKAGLIGVSEKGISQPLPQSSKDLQFFDIGTKDYAQVAGADIEQRNALVRAIQEKERTSDYKTALKAVIEEVAYTWFNRLIAIRFMEVNEYLPSRIRVLSSENPAKNEPDFVTTPFDTDMEFTMAEQDRIMQMKDENKLDELFRMLFVKQCNKLHEILPELFEETNHYTELLLSISFTDRDGVVYHLVHDIPEDDFNVEKEGQVEIIGWMYQYYNIEPKDETFALLKKNVKITKERIPAATQLFTPDWIVRYMVENSLGRLWVEGHPNDSLKENWKYYLEEAEQEASVQAQLEQIRAEYRKLNPEDIKVIDPCMGSGHILVYCFDVLMQIYESQGYTQRDAAQSILENNLFGLDIDKRAAQLAYFAVMMKARQYDRRIFTREIKPHVYAIEESNSINRGQMKYFGADLSSIERNEAMLQITGLLDTMVDAKEYGSILNVENYDWKLLQRFAESIDDAGQMSLDTIGIDQTQEQLLDLIEIAHVMAQKYEVVVTNPPYMGASGMSARLSKYVKDNYSDSKSDLFAVFIERCGQMTAKNCYQAMITQHAWMFLSSFEKLRTKLLMTDTVNMVHLGARAFEEIGGEVVQTTSFVLRKSHMDYKGTYCRLIEPTTQQGKEDMFLAGENRYAAQQSDFSKIPGAPVAYWVSDAFIDAFDGNPKLRSIARARSGAKTGKNDIFIKSWWEVAYPSIYLNCSNYDECCSSGAKWFPYNKGGDGRNWYGNRDLVVDFQDGGENIRRYSQKYGTSIDLNATDVYFGQGITWTALTSAKNTFRFSPSGSAFDSNKGPMIFNDDTELLNYLLSFFISPVAQFYIKVFNPSLSLQNGDMDNLPIIIDEKRKLSISKVAEQNVRESKNDWDSFETSWDFLAHPLILAAEVPDLNGGHKATLSDSYAKWEALCENRFNQLKANEEELNRIFIDIYGLQDELTPEVEDKDVTVRKADLGRDIRSLLSYAVGCMFGRYSLDEPGLAYAGGEWDSSKYSTFIPDMDNCIPITDEAYFEDDIVGQFVGWMKKAFGEENLEANLDFIAKALGNKGATSREVIRNYFLNNFMKDHIKIYQKRPIYWLFDSGKQNGFKALVYMHRWNADTVGNLRVEYLHKMQHTYEREIIRMQETIDNSSVSREVSKATKRKDKLQKQLKETKDYDAKLAHIALSRIDIDLDDGVKVNYEKVQTGRDGKKMQILAKI
ncbi:BREX-1 system adenine-specific DNA-methyltransferase PglX [Butyricicoccus porcorum]|uniref:site-specific DNA-methyltransferase (adenine-specific) n=1 Tax=Butyricicoccus porcorum TaxID=1945634 RepID=A0A252F153_9FIRM|nr:BREX-1 system adenine-specific DNA-methyltransferase PglX [Butyricicoccus porcorum]OUM19543.1 restriction endonuclease [Butyricicoccus porcorum]